MPAMKISRRAGRGITTLLVLWVAVFELRLFAAESPWQRVVVIGASASAGFVLSEPFGGTHTARCRLNRYLDAAIATPHAPVKNLASALFFLNPESFGPLQVEAATNDRPSLVIGVDFLFWFCYGDGGSDAGRAARFEDGLKLLDEIHCPLVVGDIPDAASATNTGIISIAQVPSEAARRAANQRLREWAARHPQVTIMPLAEFMRATKANRAIKIHGRSLPAGTTRALLQADQLHPAPQGTAALALGILDVLVARQREFPAQDIRWNRNKVFQLGSRPVN